jgi:hypothetical protein
MSESARSMAFSDDAIRRFLLGELAAAEQEAFEKRLVADDELEARVRLSELGLADDYVRQRLSRGEYLRVHERFLVTRERQHMAAVSQELHDRFAPATHASVPGFFNLNHAAWRYAFAAIILIIVFATVWLGVKERHVAIRILTPKPVAPKASPTQSPVVAHHPAVSSAPTHQEEATPPREHQTTPSIALDAKNTVENPFELKLPEGTVSLRAVLSLEKNRPDSYRAELWDSRGESLFSVDGLTPGEEGKLVVEIPAQSLYPGDYMIRLTGKEDAPALPYYLRIIR